MPNVMVSPLGPSPIASPVSSGGWVSAAGIAPPPTSAPAIISAAAADQSRRRDSRSSRVAEAARSKLAKWSRSCTGVRMPAWLAPSKG